MSVRIRLARLEDAGSIARVHIESWRATYEGMLPARYLAQLNRAQLTQSWRGRLVPGDTSSVWVAERSDQLVGFSRGGLCSEDEELADFAGELTLLYVHPDHVSTGVGSALFRRAVESLAAHPCYWLVVWVVERNLEARAFYEHHGMRADGGRRIDRFHGTGVPVIRYAMPLNPAIDYARLVAQSR